MSTLIGSEVASSVKRSQVYQATHQGDGLRLPLMYRSFISFTFGGKLIEDFDLIATISGDRLNKPGFAGFNDTITTYDNLDGQHYWATHYKNNQIDFTLSTDGIDQRKLDDFLYWFKAGATRELILAEHPNRAIMARVAEPPVLNLLPFEQSVEFKISSDSYTTKTTLYKGDIQLSLVMDEPHWYALMNLLGKKIGNRFFDVWDDPATGATDVNIFASQDALKILYEDGIPLGSMIGSSMLLGNGAYANADEKTITKVWSVSEEEIEWSGGEWGEGDPSGEGARVDSGNGLMGIVAGAIIRADGSGIQTLPPEEDAYFYYSGTAPAYTIISFQLTPIIDENHYIVVPNNSHSDNNIYNTITIESLHAQTLQFTTPNLYTSYNKAVDIFTNMTDGTYSWEQVRVAIRNQVRHPAIREWAMTCIKFKVGNNTTQTASLNSEDLNALLGYMEKVLRVKGNDGVIFPVTFTFNSQTGEAQGQFSYRTITGDIPNNISAWNTYGEITQNKIEDVGDMLRSNYIIIQDRNYPNSEGKVVGWTNTNDITKQYSHRITHDVEGGLSNFQILYKNMYL